MPRIGVPLRATAGLGPAPRTVDIGFVAEGLCQGGLFDGWVADCPLHYISPKAPAKRDVRSSIGN